MDRAGKLRSRKLALLRTNLYLMLKWSVLNQAEYGRLRRRLGKGGCLRTTPKGHDSPQLRFRFIAGCADAEALLISL